nr:myosin-10-like isoform X1 [Quercus suber]
MASDMAGQLQSGNACCKMWKEKYASLEYKRNALRQAVNILQPQIDRFQAENANLRKAYEEEQARADNEKEGRLKESMARVSLENEISTLKSEISSLQQKTSTNALDRNEEVKILKVRVSEGEKEINRLKELLGKEKRRADAERKNAEGEKKKAAEELKSIKAEKSKADEQRSFAKIEGAKAEQYRLQLEMLKKEADEAKSKLTSETIKFEQANKKLEAEKQKAIKERKRVESEMAKVEEQRKLAEANGKKALQEKCRAENLSRQLEENRQSVEELQKEILEFVSSRNLAPSGGQVDNKLNPEYEKMKDRIQSKISNVKVEEPKLVLELFKESKKRFEIEKQKAIDEKKRADLDIAKVEEQAKLVEVNWKMAMEEKCRADQLTQQLQEDKRTIEELQKKIHELLSSRKLVDGSVVPPHRVINSEYSNVKHLNKQLRFEKLQAKHAKQVAKFEKSRNHIMQQEFGLLKMEFDKFANHLYISNNSFSPSTEGTDDLEKAWHIACMQRLNMKKQLCCLEQSQAHFQSENELLKPSCMDMDSSDPVRKTLQCSASLLPLSGGNFAESISVDGLTGKGCFFCYHICKIG